MAEKVAETGMGKAAPVPWKGRVLTQEEIEDLLVAPAYGASVKERKGQKRLRTMKRRHLRDALLPTLHGKLPLVWEQHNTTGDTLFDGVSERDVVGHMEIAWDDLPPSLNPSSGGVPEARAQRKRKQVENAVCWCRALVRQVRARLPADGSRVTVVEMCAGGGHLGLVLAFLEPEVDVVLVDYKELSIEAAVKRINDMGLSNVTTFCGRIEDFLAKGREFHIGLGLHACGPASDAIHKACLTASASYVIVPCCYGFIQSAVEDQVTSRRSRNASEKEDAEQVKDAGHTPAATAALAEVSYPRSETLKSEGVGMSEALYHVAAGTSDGTYWKEDARYEDFSEMARRSMCCVDTDRSLAAEECGYRAAVVQMCEDSGDAGLKNHVLVGRSPRLM